MRSIWAVTAVGTVMLVFGTAAVVQAAALPQCNALDTAFPQPG